MASVGDVGDGPILAWNCGSSSLKFGLYSGGRGANPELLSEGVIEEIGHSASKFSFTGHADSAVAEEKWVSIPDHATALKCALDALKKRASPDPTAVGHRFVHGGPNIRAHQRVTAEVLEQLEAASEFAPLHVPQALAVLKTMQEQGPPLPQIVCLDTAFHNGLPDIAKTYAIPAHLRALGIERFGFHGLSLESVIAQLDPVPERLIVAHLGNGSSITAILNGRSIDTSMGFTPNAGAMMGTRCGDLDPGIATFALRRENLDAEKLDALLNSQSGLLGISELTSDVRELLRVRKENAKADLALRMFAYQVRKVIASMAAALGGVNAIVFTGGIGEHAKEVRDEIVSGLGFLGDVRITTLRANEDLQIARITAKLTS